MCVCVYVCMYVCMYVCVSVVGVSMYTYILTHDGICVHGNEHLFGLL